MKAIGGYFELEDFVRNEYYPDLIKMNLGRTALVYLLEKLGCRKLYLPYFLCDSVTECVQRAGYETEFYSIDRDLTVQLDTAMAEDAYVYLVNYYGQLTDEAILAYKEKYGNIIVDHTHSFFQRPLKGIPTIYSCRKYFGLPDGAYISAEIDTDDLTQRDSSKDRMAHILGRYEGDASEYYSIMLENAARFHEEPVKAMSRLTENMLNAIDYDRVRRQRNENYAYLQEALGADNALAFCQPDGPFVYPFYCPDAQQMRKDLAAKKIYIPVYWSNVITDMPQDSVEYDYAAHIMPLPCDQRYTPDDLTYMVQQMRLWRKL